MKMKIKQKNFKKTIDSHDFFFFPRHGRISSTKHQKSYNNISKYLTINGVMLSRNIIEPRENNVNQSYISNA